MDVAYCSSQKIIRDGSSKKILELQLVEHNDPVQFFSRCSFEAVFQNPSSSRKEKPHVYSLGFLNLNSSHISQNRPLTKKKKSHCLTILECQPLIQHVFFIVAY